VIKEKAAATTTKAMENANKEATDKVAEEERQKKDVETRNDDTQPMDTDTQEVSIASSNTQTPSSCLELGIWAPF
jgi:hypothetical protein